MCAREDSGAFALCARPSCQPPRRPPGPPDGLWPGGSWPFPGPRAPPGTCPHRPGLIPPTAQGAQIPSWHLSSLLLDSSAAPRNSSCEGRSVYILFRKRSVTHQSPQQNLPRVLTSGAELTDSETRLLLLQHRQWRPEGEAETSLGNRVSFLVP